MRKLSFQQLCEYANEYFKNYPSRATQFNKFAPQAVIVFKPESFNQKYSLEARSYKFSLANKFFLPDMGGNSIFADCLDGSEQGVRLDWYFGSWIIDYCYISKYNHNHFPSPTV